MLVLVNGNRAPPVQVAEGQDLYGHKLEWGTAADAGSVRTDPSLRLSLVRYM